MQNGNSQQKLATAFALDVLINKEKMKYIFIMSMVLLQILCTRDNSQINKLNLKSEIPTIEQDKKNKEILIEIEINDRILQREGLKHYSVITTIKEGKVDFFNATISATIAALLCKYQGLNCHNKNGHLKDNIVHQHHIDEKYLSIQGEYDKEIFEVSGVAALIYSKLHEKGLFQMDTVKERLSIYELVELDKEKIEQFINQDEEVFSGGISCSGAGGWRNGEMNIQYKGKDTILEMIKELMKCFGIEIRMTELLSEDSILRKNIDFDFKTSDDFNDITNALLPYGIMFKETSKEKEIYFLELKKE